MAEWLVEEGIGEVRAALVEDGRILAARIEWPAPLKTGMVAPAQIVSRRRGSQRGTVRFESGAEALADGLPADATEGSTITVRVTREAIAERGRGKLAQVRPAPAERTRPAPSLADALAGASAIPVRACTVADGRLDAAGWSDLVAEALDGSVSFPGGSLTISPTPAMTLIDIDGDGAPAALALASVPAIADALARFDVSGSVGIDFPTITGKGDRQAVDAALAQALAEGPGEWRGERTAMNGFGFVQLVSRLERPSIMHLYERTGAAAARVLMRRAEAVRDPGALLLTAHPAVRRHVLPAWEADLARRTGRGIVWSEDAGLAPAAAFAQALQP